MPEPIPSALTTTMLDTYWDSNNVAEPTMFDVNSGTVGVRANLRNPGGDHIIIKIDTPGQEETPIGNWTYGNRLTRVLLELYTSSSRQRVYDLMAEVRRICHLRMHLETDYQRIQFRNWTEMVNENQNIWSGRIILEYVNNAVLLEV